MREICVVLKHNTRH